MEIDKDIAKQPINNTKIYFPEFEKYEIYKGKTTVKPKEGNLTQAFRYVGNGLGSLSSYFGGKYEEYDIGNKIKSGGTATWNGISTAGSYLLNFTKFASGKAVQGVNYFYKQITGNNDNKHQKGNLIIEKEESDDDDNEENNNRIILSNNEDDNEKDNNIYKKPDKNEDEDEDEDNNKYNKKKVNIILDNKNDEDNNEREYNIILDNIDDENDNEKECNIIKENKKDEDDNEREFNIIEENEESVNNSAAPIGQIRFQK